MENFAAILRDRITTIRGVTRHEFDKESPLIYESGVPADGVLFLDTGLVKVLRDGPEGRQVLLHLVRPGELFGDFPPGGARLSNAYAVLPSQVFDIPRVEFKEFCDSTPEVARLYAESLGNRLIELNHKIEMLTLYDVEARVMDSLAELAEHLAEGPQKPAQVPLTQSELAKLIGATRETTSTTLNVLERRGLVRLGRGRMFVPSTAALRSAQTSARAKAALR